MSSSRDLVSEDVQQGVVLWLPPKDDLLAQCKAKGYITPSPVTRITLPKRSDEGFYGHPILIVSRPAGRPEKIHFLLRTTFNGQSLAQRFPGRLWWRYMAMAPATKHPLAKTGDSMYPILKFGRGRGMEKPGYVDVSNVYEMDWKLAQRFWTGPREMRQLHRLSKGSFRSLLSTLLLRIRYEPSKQFNLYDKFLLKAKQASRKGEVYLDEIGLVFEDSEPDENDSEDSDTHADTGGSQDRIIPHVLQPLGLALLAMVTGFVLMKTLIASGYSIAAR